MYSAIITPPHPLDGGAAIWQVLAMTRASLKPAPAADDEAATLAAVEEAMVRMRRALARRRLACGPDGVDALQFAVVDAVEAGPDSTPDSPGDEVTVGAVAERLGLDPSQASRLVAQAIAAGLVLRRASQADARRIGLALTAAGRALVERKHRARRAFAAQLMEGWSARDRSSFARLFQQFTRRLDSEKP
jgi:DNA-binding MarR family transcriptional regulator